jgi:hypothetical protein
MADGMCIRALMRLVYFSVLLKRKRKRVTLLHVQPVAAEDGIVLQYDQRREAWLRLE